MHPLDAPKVSAGPTRLGVEEIMERKYVTADYLTHAARVVLGTDPLMYLLSIRRVTKWLIA